jgi:hypothetical protein
MIGPSRTCERPKKESQMVNAAEPVENIDRCSTRCVSITQSVAGASGR